MTITDCKRRNGLLRNVNLNASLKAILGCLANVSVSSLQTTTVTTAPANTTSPTITPSQRAYDFVAKDG